MAACGAGDRYTEVITIENRRGLSSFWAMVILYIVIGQAETLLN